jgi:glycosyltransferase involved in cell wall biosynthesis
VYRSVGLVACNSEATAAAARTVYGSRIAYAVVPPGVDLSSASGLDRPPLTTDPRIVSVGALRPLKGHRDLVEALANVADLPWSWTVIGDGPEREGLAELLDRSGLRGRVTFTGEVLDPLTHMANADLLLHGAMTEGFGAVIVEALSVGTPVIAADAPGPAEILRNGGGWVFRRGDRAGAARLLRVALTEPHSLPSQHICRHIAARYSIERSVDALEALLNPVGSQ